jgi:hypothetical protein
MLAGSRRSRRTLRPSARIVDPDNTMNATPPTSITTASKRKAPASESSPPRRVVPRINTDSCDEHEGEAGATGTPCEVSEGEDTDETEKYEALQVMADADHQARRLVSLSWCSLLTSRGHLPSRLFM